jgi:hypothetical protein
MKSMCAMANTSDLGKRESEGNTVTTRSLPDRRLEGLHGNCKTDRPGVFSGRVCRPTPSGVVAHNGVVAIAVGRTALALI